MKLSERSATGLSCCVSEGFASGSNNTNTTILSHTVIEQGAGFLEIYAAKEGEPFKKWQETGLIVPDMVVVENKLKPGYKKRGSGRLYCILPPFNITPEKYDPNDIIKCYLLSFPGTYQIQATLKNVNGKETIESNIITIEAMQPTGQDAAAYDVLKTVPHPLFLMKSFGRHLSKYDQQVLAKQQNFLSQFSNSSYACYMNYALGRTYTAKKGDYLDDGILLLEKAASYEDFFLAEESLNKLVNISIKEGNLEKARDYLSILKERFPNKPEYTEQVTKVNRLISNKSKQ